jgi:hypothetical protein
MEDGDSASLLHDTETPHGNHGRIFDKRQRIRLRSFLMIVAVFGVIVVPLAVFYTFGGIEGGASEWIPTIVGVPHEPPEPTPVRVPSDETSSSISAPSFTLLPERRLTEFVVPLIGTEGTGHSNSSLIANDLIA